MLYLMLDGLILFDIGDFHHVRCLWDGFKSRILGGACHFRWDPYLNSTAVLFDTSSFALVFAWVIDHLRFKLLVA